LPEGRGRAIAATVAGTRVAMVIEVSVRDDRLRIDRVVTAVDCGIVINPQLVKAQVEGSIVFGLTAALKGAITIERGRVEQSNFVDYPLLGIAEMPKIETILGESNETPTGTGEQISHPVAAALANAVISATKRRIRSLPIQLSYRLPMENWRIVRLRLFTKTNDFPVYAQQYWALSAGTDSENPPGYWIAVRCIARLAFS
jgi:isoquinoline 1-oxidoreductase subunit beta